MVKTILFDGTNFLYPIKLKADSNLFKHANLDLAVIICELPNRYEFKGTSIKLTNLTSRGISQIASKNEIYSGKEIIFLGFPDGIGTFNGFGNSNNFRDVKTNPLVRKGIISWMPSDGDVFLIDGFSFGGNSGSPVFSVPPFEEYKLIGMVTGHLSNDF